MLEFTQKAVVQTVVPDKPADMPAEHRVLALGDRIEELQSLAVQNVRTQDIGASELQANGPSRYPSISGDGRYVAFCRGLCERLDAPLHAATADVAARARDEAEKMAEAMQ